MDKTQERTDKLLLLLSILIMEFSNVKEERDVLLSLLNLVKKVVDVNDLVLVDENKRVVLGRELDVSRFEEFIEWATKQASPAFVEEAGGYVGIIPWSNSEGPSGV